MDLFDQIFDLMNGKVGQSIILGVLGLVGFIILIACIDGMGMRDTRCDQSRKSWRWKKGA